MAEAPSSGTTLTETYYVHVQPYAKSGVGLWNQDMSELSPEYICLGPVEISYTIPEHKDITQLKVESLEQQIEKMNAEHYVKVQNIEDQIQRLLCIGHDEPLPRDEEIPF